MKATTIKPIYKGRVISVSVDTVPLPNGNTVDLEIVRHPGAAAVVPIDADGNVLMVRQMRYVTGGELLEVPAGKLDAGESPETCARRELEEEAGVRAARYTSLGFIHVSPGFTDEKIHLFLAQDLTATKQALEADEVLSVERVAFDRAVAMARSAELTDAKTIVALLRAESHLNAKS